MSNYCQLCGNWTFMGTFSRSALQIVRQVFLVTAIILVLEIIDTFKVLIPANISGNTSQLKATFIYTNTDWVKCQEGKDTRSLDGNENGHLTEGCIQTHPGNQSEQMMWQASAFCKNFIAATLNGTLVCMAPCADMHA